MKQLIYLDQAATTYQKPVSVLAAVRRGAEMGNPGRGGHVLALKSAKEVYKTRETAANFFEAPSPEHICFFYNATSCINTVMKTLLKKGQTLLISSMEHNAVRRPAISLSKQGVFLKYFDGFGEEKDIIHSFEESLAEKPDLAVFLHTSNVCMQSLPVEKLCAIARKRGVLTLVDCAQAGGIAELSLRKIGCDGMVLPGHKGLFGIMGIGMLVVNSKMKKKLEEAPTLTEGGGGVDSLEEGMPKFLPERLESGTQGLPAIMALRSGMEFLTEQTLDRIRYKHDLLYQTLREGLSVIHDVELYGQSKGLGPTLFRMKCYDAAVLSEILSGEGICMREGLHCAPLAHQRIGTLKLGGGIRASVSCFNSKKEIDTFLKVLNHL